MINFIKYICRHNLVSQKFNLLIINILIILILVFPWIIGLEYGSSLIMISNIFSSLPEGSAIYSMSTPGRTEPMVNGDFHNIYVPIQDSLNYSYKNGFVFYDYSRFLGMELTGHPISAPYNPLNFLVQNFSPEFAIYIKSVFWLVVQGLGLYLMCSSIKKSNFSFIYFFIVFLIFLPNNIYYIHWDNYLAITATFPYFIFAINKYFETGKYLYLLVLTTLAFLQPVLNMFELSFYIGVFVFVYILSLLSSWFLLKEFSKDKLIKCFLIFISVIIGFIFASPALIDLYEYSLNLSRLPSDFLSILDRQPYLPKNIIQLFSFSGIPLPAHFILQHSMLIPFGILIIFLYLFYKIFLIYEIKSNAYFISLVITCIYCFLFLYIGYVDAPFMFFDIYKVFANQSRVINLFYILLTAIMVITFETFSDRNVSKFVNKKFLSIVKILNAALMIGIFVMIYFNYKIIPNRISEIMSNADYLIYIFSLIIIVNVFLNNLSNKSKKSSINLVALGLILGLIFMRFSTDWQVNPLNIKYSERAIQSRSILTNNVKQFIDPGIYKLNLGGDIHALGLSPITGYDTGLNNDLYTGLNDILDNGLRNYWNTESDMSFAQFGSYWAPSKNIHSLVESNNEKQLKTLGVGKILYKESLPEKKLPYFSQNFNGHTKYIINNESFFNFTRKGSDKINFVSKGDVIVNKNIWEIQNIPDKAVLNIPLKIDIKKIKISQQNNENKIYETDWGFQFASSGSNFPIRLEFVGSFNRWLYMTLTMIIMLSLILYLAKRKDSL